MLSVAAARLEHDYANPKLVSDLRAAAKVEAEKIADGRGHTEEDQKRVERQRTLFVMLPDTSATDRLKKAIKQRVYDLMWDGSCAGADALLEFLPEADATEILDAWDNDQDSNNQRSSWYDG